MGSSAQISSGVRRCGLQAQVPEGSGGFCKVPVCAGAGSGGRFRNLRGSGGRFRRVSEGAGGFKKVPERWRRWQVQRFQKVWGGHGRFRTIPESSRARLPVRVLPTTLKLIFFDHFLGGHVVCKQNGTPFPQDWRPVPGHGIFGRPARGMGQQGLGWRVVRQQTASRTVRGGASLEGPAGLSLFFARFLL